MLVVMVIETDDVGLVRRAQAWEDNADGNQRAEHVFGRIIGHHCGVDNIADVIDDGFYKTPDGGTVQLVHSIED